MPNFIDLTGQRFGRLTVLECVERGKKTKWLCQCDCGNKTITLVSSLKSGSTKSCGCLHKESMKKICGWNRTHGESTSTGNTRLHGVWTAMKSRIYNPNNKKYPCYGGRGITMCDEWKNDYLSFKKWAMENGYNPNEKRL